MTRALRRLAVVIVAVLTPGWAAGTGVTRLEAEALTRMAADWLVAHLGGEVDAGAIEPLAAPRELVLPAGALTVQMTLQSGSVAAGTLTVAVEATVTDERGSRVTRSTTVAFRVRALREVLVAVRELPRRTVIAPGDLRAERRAASRVPAGAVQDLADVVGKELTRTLAPGEVVTAQALTAPVVVRRGSVVSLVVEGPSFRIVARGVAAEDGARGETIRVVNQASRREVVGRVEDAHTVRVPF